MKTLLIDNYDSFTYNLFQYLSELKANPVIYKNDALSLREIEKIAPTHIIISPGPGSVENKKDFGICKETILYFGPTIPLLGVCLGHQGIIDAFQGKIEEAPEIMHGKQSLIEHDDSILFQNIPTPFSAMRYHSLCGSLKNFPPDLKITAWTNEKKTIMAIQHLKYPIFGIQFHPESFQTDYGKQLLSNFLSQ